MALSALGRKSYNYHLARQLRAVATCFGLKYNLDMHSYWSVMRFNFSIYSAYPLEVVAIIARRLVELGFLALFWSIIAHSSSGQIHTQQLMAYFLIATGIGEITMVLSLKIGRELARAIKFGQISSYLLMPSALIPMLVAEQVGKSGVGMMFAVVTIVLGVLLEPLPGLLALGAFLIAFVIACAISLSLNLFIGAIAFRTIEATSIKNVGLHVIKVMSGAIVPLSLFPGSLRTVVLALPFASAVYAPARALSGHLEPHLLIVGLLWAIVLLPVSFWFFKRGLRSYEAIGL